MKTIILALLAVSMIFALSPIGESFAQTDNVPPTILTDEDSGLPLALVVGPNVVTIKFSEPVTAGTDSFTSLIANTALNPITDITRDVVGISGIGTDTLTLYIDGDPLPPDTGFTIVVDETLMDLSGNSMDAAQRSISVTDGQPPAIVSAVVTAPNTITIKFTESMTVFLGDFTDLKIDGITRLVIGVSGSGTDTITLAVSGFKIAAGAGGTIDMRSGFVDTSTTPPTPLSLVDGAGNALDEQNDYPVTADPTPTVKSAEITTHNTIRVEFSGYVSATNANFADFSLTGGTGITVGESRNITVNLASSSSDPNDPDRYNVVFLTVSPGNLPTDATGTIDIRPTFGVNSNGDRIPTGLADASGNWVSPLNDYPVESPDIETRLTNLETLITNLTERVIALEALLGSTPEPEPEPEPIPDPTPEPEPETQTGIQGKIYTDTNNNKRYDAGEPLLAEMSVVSINLSDHSDTEKDRTDTNGEYFIEREAGSYLVQVEGTDSFAYIDVRTGSTTTQNLGIPSTNTNSGNTGSGSCVLFCDSTGYEPNWAKSIGENQALSRCLSVDYGTKDFDWCGEFSGYLLDKDTGNTGNTGSGSCVLFCDSTGYEPNWAKSIGENQALSRCLSVDYGTKDFDWCGEFSGYLLDKLS